MLISSEQYKALRIQCTKGQSHQLEIFNTYCKKIDDQNILDFTKLLVNVTVANLKTQQEAFSMLPSIDLTPENSKFILMIVNNILSDQLNLSDDLISQNPKIVSLILQSILSGPEDLFEWSFYIFSKVLPGRLQTLSTFLDAPALPKFLNFLISLCDKSWNSEQPLIPDILNLKDLAFLPTLYEQCETEVLILLNYASRIEQYQENLASIVSDSDLLGKLYLKLSSTKEEGMKGTVLQVLSNTLFPFTMNQMTENIKIVLHSADLDVNQPTCREWVFVIIKKGIEFSNEFKELLQELNINPHLSH